MALKPASLTGALFHAPVFHSSCARWKLPPPPRYNLWTWNKEEQCVLFNIIRHTVHLTWPSHRPGVLKWKFQLHNAAFLADTSHGVEEHRLFPLFSAGLQLFLNNCWRLSYLPYYSKSALWNLARQTCLRRISCGSINFPPAYYHTIVMTGIFQVFAVAV